MIQIYKHLALTHSNVLNLLIIGIFLLFSPLFVPLQNAVLHAGEQQISKKVCPSCKKTYPGDAKYCAEDGKELISKDVTKACPICKKPGKPGAKYCIEHGEKLVPMEELPPAAKESEDTYQKKVLAKKYYLEGNAYCDEKSYDLALKSYKKAEDAMPDFPALHHNMGWLYGKLGKIELAIKHLQKYIALAPGAEDITEVQSRINVLEELKEKRNKIIKKYETRDKIMKEALEEQKKKYDMVSIPAGEIIMRTNEGRVNSFPEHTVYLDAYEIDRYEVTNAQYWEFIKYIEETNDHSKCYKGEPSGKDHKPMFWEKDYYNHPDYPVTRIDWYDAYAYAAWAGKRLPTEAEWEKAARGLDGRRFPWGNEWIPAKCNLSGEPKPVGSLEGGKSIFGCYDMSGSVYEWCSDWYSRSYYSESPSLNPKGPKSGTRKVIRGGSRFSKPFQVLVTARKSERPDLFNRSLGFRCAWDVEEDEEK